MPRRLSYIFARLFRPSSLNLKPKKTFLDLPNELIFQITGDLGLSDLNHLLRTNHFLKKLISPIFFQKAATSFMETRKQRRTLLHWASVHNRVELLMQLLNHGARVWVNKKCISGVAPLHSAVILENEKVVQILLENGADTEVYNSRGWTPLISAAANGNDSITRLLLDNGAKTELKSLTSSEGSALHYAAALGHAAVVDVLLEMGAKTSTVDSWESNAVHYASVSGQEMVKRLLDHGEHFKFSEITSSQHKYLLISMVSIRYHHIFNRDDEKDYCRACTIR